MPVRAAPGCLSSSSRSASSSRAGSTGAGRRRVLVHRRIEIGRRARQLDRLLVVSLDMREDAGGAQALDLDLIGPIRVLGLVQLVLERLQLADLRLRGGEVAGVRGAERARERDHRLGPREFVEREADRRRRRAPRPLSSRGVRARSAPGSPRPRRRSADWHRRFGETRSARRRHLLRLAVLRGLQVGVFEIVHRVDGLAVEAVRAELLVDIADRRVMRGVVRLDRLLPQSRAG